MHSKITLDRDDLERLVNGQSVWTDDRKTEICLENGQSRPPLTLKIDDIVNLREDDGSVKTQTVTCEPWQLGDGTWVVGLNGWSGGFLLDRVTLNRRGKV